MLAMPSSSISVMVSMRGQVMAARSPGALPAGCCVFIHLHLHTTMPVQSVYERPTWMQQYQNCESLLVAEQQIRGSRCINSASIRQNAMCQVAVPRPQRIRPIAYATQQPASVPKISRAIHDPGLAGLRAGCGGHASAD